MGPGLGPWDRDLGPMGPGPVNSLYANIVYHVILFAVAAQVVLKHETGMTWMSLKSVGTVA